MAPSPNCRRHTPAVHGGESVLARRSRDIGYGGVLVLAFVLPFDMAQRPLLWTGYLSVTNLTVLLVTVAGLAILPVAGVVVDALRGSREASDYLIRRRVSLVLLVAYLLSALISTILAHSSAQGVTWFLRIVAGALLWLALPLWLADDTKVKVNRLGIAIVAGAIVASIAGLIEVLTGRSFDQHLTLFKAGPDTVGPFLRLSATFSSANVAAMYLEWALPFAVVGLIAAVGRMVQGRIVFAAWLAAMDTLLIALLLTYSRGALLGLVAAALAMALATRKEWRSLATVHARRLTVVVANLMLVVAWFATSSSTVERLRFSTQNDRT